MRIEESVLVDAGRDEVWRLIERPAAYARLMAGVTRWEVDGERETGCGARYAMRMRVGSAEVGGTVEIVEFHEGCDLAWTSITGPDQRGRWRLRDGGNGRTRVTLRIAYHAPGGLMGTLADALAAPSLRRNVRSTLDRLRRVAEGDAYTGAPAPGRVATVASQLEGMRVLAGTGLVRPVRPDRLAQTLIAMARWGFTPAAGFAASAARYPDATAVVDERGRLTFAEVHARSNALARGLASLGIGEGDRVAVLCRNHRGFVETIAALSKLGADALLLNTSFAGPQITEVVRREHAHAVVHDAEFADLLHDAMRRRIRVVAWPDGGVDGDGVSVDSLVAEHDDGEMPSPERAGRVVILTSGTTGSPKGASRSNPTSIEPAVALLSRIPLHTRGTTVIAAPLFHAWGFAHLMLSLLLSSTLVLQRRFDPERTLEVLAEEHADVLVAVPVMLQRLLEVPPEVRELHDTSALRVVAVSGSQLPGPLAARFMDEFGDVVYNLYGSTEVAWASIATPEELRAAPGTAGRPPRGTVVRILDDDGIEVPTGYRGRIFVGNTMLFEGYTGGGDKQRLGNLMSTGDVGRFDEAGLLFVEGRDDEMIVSGGENVFPREVEELLSERDDVADVAVVGVDDEEWGQRLRAFVVPRGGARLSEDEVKDHVRRHLARYKVPRDVVFVDTLPRNATGKVVKRQLHDGGVPDGAGKGAPTRTAPRRRGAAPSTRPVAGGSGSRRGGGSRGRPRP